MRLCGRGAELTPPPGGPREPWAPALGARHVAELAAELGPLLAGSLIREVQAHPPRDLLLILEPRADADPDRPPGSVRRLRLSASPEGPRFHLQVGPVERHRGAIGPFFQRVASELEGGKLRGLAPVRGDRILRLDLAGADGRPRSLILELFGRQANLVLLDAAGKILAVAVSPSPGSRAAERLAPGLAFELPGAGRGAGQSGGSPRPEPPPLAEALPDPPPPPERSAPLAHLAPLSWRVEASLGRDAESRFDERRLHALAERLERRLKGARDHARGLERRMETCAGADRLRMDAELLVAHLHLVQRGMKSVELEDAFHPEGPPRVVDLDPGLSPRRNVERLFSAHRKLLRAAEALPAEMERTHAQVQGLEARLGATREPGADPDALEEEAVAGGWLPPRQEVKRAKSRPEPRRPYHRFFALHGGEIRVGRNARDNDALTFHHSRGGDLWLHTADAPGSHVILIVPKGSEPDPEEVLDAAQLAIHFSPLKGCRQAGVHVAWRKEVRKPKRAPAGLVTLSGGKTRRIRVEPERLERLLATRGKPRPGAADGPSAPSSPPGGNG